MGLSVGTLQVSLRLDKGSFDSDVSSSEGRVRGFGSAIGSIGGNMFGYYAAYQAINDVFRLIGATIVTTIQAGVQFQDALNVLGAVTGATTAQMDAMKKMAFDLGNDLSLPSVSAADAANAMVELAKAGLNVDQTMLAAKGTLQLAAAANISAGDAAKYTANALNAFQLDGSKAADVANYFANAANASSGEALDFANALQNAGSAAHLAKLPLDQFMASIAELNNAGLKGADAGTALKVMFQRLEGSVKTSDKAMAAMGITVYDAQGNMLPFTNIINQFSVALAGMTQQQKLATLETVFGSRANQAMAILAQDGAAGLDQMTAAIDKQGGAASVAAARSQGLGGAYRGLQNEVQTLQLEIFDNLQPTLISMTQLMTAAISAVGTNGPKAFQDMGDAINKVKTQFSWVTDSFTAWDSLSKHGNYKAVGEGIANAILESLSILTKDNKKIDGYLSQMISSVDWAGAGRQMGVHAPEVAHGFAEALGQSFRQALANGGSDLIPAPDQVFGAAWTPSGLSTLIIDPIIYGLTAGLLEKAAGHSIKSQDLFGALIDYSSPEGVVGLLMNRLLGKGGSLFDDFGKELEKQAKAHPINIQKLLDDMLGGGSGGGSAGGVGAGINMGSILTPQGIQAMFGFLDGMQQEWGAVMGWLGQTGSRSVAAVGTLSTFLVGHGIELLQGLWQGSQQKWGETAGWLGGIGPMAWGAVGSLAGWLVGSGSSLIGGLLSGIDSAWQTVSGWLGGVGGRIVSAVGSLSGILVAAGQEAVNGLISGLKSKLGDVGSAAQALGQAIKDNKGPIEYDRVMLVPAGIAIMSGLNAGLIAGYQSQVAPTLAGITASIANSQLPTGNPNQSPAQTIDNSKTDNRTNSITVNAQTNADPNDIAATVARRVARLT